MATPSPDAVRAQTDLEAVRALPDARLLVLIARAERTLLGLAGRDWSGEARDVGGRTVEGQPDWDRAVALLVETAVAAGRARELRLRGLRSETIGDYRYEILDTGAIQVSHRGQEAVYPVPPAEVAALLELWRLESAAPGSPALLLLPHRVDIYDPPPGEGGADEYGQIREPEPELRAGGVPCRVNSSAQRVAGERWSPETGVTESARRVVYLEPISGLLVTRGSELRDARGPDPITGADVPVAPARMRVTDVMPMTGAAAVHHVAVAAEAVSTGALPPVGAA